MPRTEATGFTLVESMITLAVLGILVAIGLPSFKGMIERQRALAATHLLSAQFAIARSTAISQRIPTAVCPSSDGARCSDGTDWSRGWIMYRDPGRATQPHDSPAILGWENRPASGTIQLVSTSGRRLIRFLPDGRSAGTNQSIGICSGGRLMAQVVVNNQGRVRTSRPAAAIRCTD